MTFKHIQPSIFRERNIVIERRIFLKTIIIIKPSNEVLPFSLKVKLYIKTMNRKIGLDISNVSGKLIGTFFIQTKLFL